MPAGRPRTFDPDDALDSALRVFWRKGYEGTSLPDLTKAMGINRPSLYAAFGNKEQLFRKALDRYAQGPAAYWNEAIAEPTARKVIERLLHGAVNLMSDSSNPRGCLAVQGALACGDDADCLRKELASRRRAREMTLKKRLQRARAERDLPAGTNPDELARFVATIIQGMAVQAAGGANRKQLLSIAKSALGACPL